MENEGLVTIIPEENSSTAAQVGNNYLPGR